MRTKTELWKIVQKYYPYYIEPSLKVSIYYISRSTVISDEEEQQLYKDLENYHDAKNITEGINLLSIMLDKANTDHLRHF